ncbi:hypothetical protein [Streptomyces sp. NPDC002265]|uniref:hypothetical protein n=1 Tax=Streptomyces sp. NPDC002265 TaxID=3154415 RepID=UPI0033342BBA
MLALRLSRLAHPAVQLRRLLVAAASAGTGFLLLGSLGYALGHPDTPAGTLLLRLAWCAVPLAATVQLAVAVARTDPATRPRPGLAAIGLGPARLMAISATTTALSCTLGSMVALFLFLHLRGDLTGMPFDGAAAQFLAAGTPLPLAGALTLLAVLPAVASAAAALALRPRDPRHRPARTSARGYGRFGASGGTGARETFGTYARFGARLRTSASGTSASARGTGADGDPGHGQVPVLQPRRSAGGHAAEAVRPGPHATASLPGGTDDLWSAANGAPAATGTRQAADGSARAGTAEGISQAVEAPQEDGAWHPADHPSDPDPQQPPAPRPAPGALPWGVAVLAAGLAVEAYASRSTGAGPRLPAGLATGPAGVLAGWLLTALGLALAGPGLTHLCGMLLQAGRPGVLRLLAGRVLMAEAARIGRPLGVVCAVLSATYAAVTLSEPGDASFGLLTTLGTLLVLGCTVATLLTAAVEARQVRSDTTAALLRLGAPSTMLRSAAALRAGALVALFGPLTLVVAELAALPLAHR